MTIRTIENIIGKSVGVFFCGISDSIRIATSELEWCSKINPITEEYAVRDKNIRESVSYIAGEAVASNLPFGILILSLYIATR